MWYKTRAKKYFNRGTEYNGRKYDSAFEASVARDLDIEKKAGLILDWEPQYKVEMWAYTKNGKPAFKKSHKIDFRVHNLDGTYKLLEAKGFETDDYRDRRRWLLNLWLPEHLDYEYEVVYQKKGFRKF
jgi:hypothetical protein